MNLNADRSKLLEIIEKVKMSQNMIYSDTIIAEWLKQAEELAELDDEERYYNFICNDNFIASFNQILEEITKSDKNFLNALLTNQEFIDFIKLQPKLVHRFLTKCSGEDKIYKFLIEYARI